MTKPINTTRACVIGNPAESGYAIGPRHGRVAMSIIQSGQEVHRDLLTCEDAEAIAKMLTDAVTKVRANRS